MLYTNEIPHLKIYKHQTYLPLADEHVKTLHSLVILNNKTLQSSIDTLNSRLLLANHKYMYYYLEPKYELTLRSKIVRKNLTIDRKAAYGDILEGAPKVRPVLSFDILKGKNAYYDMFFYNKIFFNSTTVITNYKSKVFMYIDLLKMILELEKFSEYKNRVITIDVDSWLNDMKESLKGKPVFDNPILILVTCMRKYFEKFKELGNVDIVFHDKTQVLLLNPSLCDKTSYPVFIRMLSKFAPLLEETVMDEEKMDSEIVKKEEIDTIKRDAPKEFNNEYKFVGDIDEVDDDLEPEYMNTSVDDDIDIDEDEKLVPMPEELKEEEVELARQIYKTNSAKVNGKSPMSLKRDAELREKQKTLKLKNATVKELQEKNANLVQIKSSNVEKHVKTTNKNMHKVKFANFEKTYNEELAAKDISSMFTNLNNMDIPVYVKSINVEDTSDNMTLKETYTVELEDENRVRHRIKVDIPTFIDDKFLYINGNEKTIIHQNFMKPIVKTGPDEVQICSNYNKIFITRYGPKYSPKIEMLKKYLLLKDNGLIVKWGKCASINNDYKTIIEYDEIGVFAYQIITPQYKLMFSQKDVYDNLNGYPPKENEMVIGFYKDKSPIIVDFNTGLIDGKYDIYGFIESFLKGDNLDTFNKITTGSKIYMYSRATIMSKKVPIVILTGYCEGLTTTLKKGNIEHYFSDKRPTLKKDEASIQFADGYLVYKTYPFENSLLLNGLSVIKTRAYDYADFDETDVYVDLFETLYGARNLANAFTNFYYSMIDPITKEILETMDYPTDFVGVILFANTLLVDNSYLLENNYELYRVRSNEIISAMLHKELADAYSKYRATSNNRNPVKISLPRDVIIKKLLSSNAIENYSKINPTAELEKTRAISPKGFSGMNMEEAYTQDKRSYDDSMKGIVAMSTSPDANVGVVRQLTMEPNIRNARGFMDINSDMNDVNLFSPAELLTPLGVTRDDPVRTAMSVKQSKHSVAVKNSCPVLISNGAEQVVQYNLSKDFIIIAAEDGVIDSYDEETGLVIAKYKSGKAQAINTKPTVVKNGAGGFFLSFQLQCDFKKGAKFSKGEILAYENKYFTNDGFNGNRMNIGSLQKIAIMPSYSTYEDSTRITKKMSEDMQTEIIMEETIIIGKNATVGSIVKVGDEVDVGDILVSYETSYDEEGLNSFLASIGDELQEDIKSLNKVPVKTHYAGTIIDIQIGTTVDLEDLSPTLRSIVSKYYAGVNKKKKILNAYDKNNSVVKCGLMIKEPSGKLTPGPDGKVNGRDLQDSVYIDFYIMHHNNIGVGDKVVFFAPSKSIVGEVIKPGYEARSMFRPDEEVSAFIGPSAVLQRKIPSIILTMFGYKVLIELKRSLEDIYNE